MTRISRIQDRSSIMKSSSTYTYSYAGRLVCSEAPVRGLEPFAGVISPSLPPGSVTLRIRTEKHHGERERLFRWPGYYELTLWAKPSGWIFSAVTGAEFHVDQSGRSVECSPGTGGWDTDAEVFARRVLPRIAQLQGGTVLHCAAMDCGGGAVLFCGSSHAGKSTMSAGLQRYFGWRSLSDDMTFLGTESTGTLAYPTEVGLCLRPDSFEKLEANMDEWRMMSVYGAKFRHEPLPVQVQARTPQPVRAIYFLEDPTEQAQGISAITSSRVRANIALATLSCFLVRFTPNRHDADAKHFSVLARVARTVPIRLLQYPRHYDYLQQVAERIHGDLNEEEKGAKGVA